MRNYNVTRHAQRDLRAIYDHIAADDQITATKVIERIFGEFEKLAKMPGIGHQRQDVKNPRYRFRIVYSYVIAFFPDSNQ